jgi:hypothetical protein
LHDAPPAPAQNTVFSFYSIAAILILILPEQSITIPNEYPFVLRPLVLWTSRAGNQTHEYDELCIVAMNGRSLIFAVAHRYRDARNGKQTTAMGNTDSLPA